MRQAVSIVRNEDGRKRTEKEKKIIPLRWFNPAKCFDVSRETQRKRLYIVYSDRATVSARARRTILYFTPRSHIPRTINRVRDTPKIDSSHNHSADLYLYI